jgi:RNA polymerase subunit RPABC4/transcription elongation factor Spt4
MKKCNNCGQNLDESAKFCTSCGSNSIFDSSRQAAEYKRTCNQCSQTWHTLVEREEEIKRGLAGNKKEDCCNMCDENAKRQREMQKNTYENEYERLKTCPKCGSGNFAQELVTYEKK